MANFDPQKTPGAFEGPPADAPREVSDRVIPGDIITVGLDGVARSALQMAAQNEQVLAPLIMPRPMPMPMPVQAAQPVAIPPSASKLRMPGVPRPSVATPAETVPVGATSALPAAEPTIILTDAPPIRRAGSTPLHGRPLDDDGAIELHVGVPPARQARPAVDAVTAAYLESPVGKAARDLAAARVVTHQPAASATDSPSRGIPTSSADPGKQITGGFGDAGDAQYFPLDGSELRELVRGLMSVIDRQLDDDLRFSMAVTYPRVAAKVVIEIQAYAAGDVGGKYDPSFEIVRVMVPHEKTPIAVARERADEIVFCVIADRTEMTPDGTSMSPPNAIRAELGLLIPRKQAIQTPQGRLIVDLPSGMA